MRADCHQHRIAVLAFGLHDEGFGYDLDVGEAGLLQILLDLLRRGKIWFELPEGCDEA